jgi:hypothetical protein
MPSFSYVIWIILSIVTFTQTIFEIVVEAVELTG